MPSLTDWHLHDCYASWDGYPTNPSDKGGSVKIADADCAALAGNARCCQCRYCYCRGKIRPGQISQGGVAAAGVVKSAS